MHIENDDDDDDYVKKSLVMFGFSFCKQLLRASTLTRVFFCKKKSI